jgi:outer membrane protein assembly factor BamD (BamD/ComL family)
MEGQQERHRQAICKLLLSARTQREIEAAYEAADRYLRQYPEDRDLIYAASQQTYSRELQLRRSGDWQD